MRDLYFYFPLLWTTLATIVAVAIGYAVGFFGIGWVLALLLVLFIVNYLQYNRDQVTIALMWYGCLFFSYLANSPWGVAALLIGVAFGGYLSAYTIRDLFRDNTLVTIKYILGRLIGRLGERQVLESPKKGLQEAIQRHYGPRLVVVPRHVAARMRRASDRIKIVGPGTYFTEPFEYVEQVYNLRPLHRTYRFSKVLTQDLFAVDVTVAVIYSIDVPEGRWLGAQELTESDRAKINDIDCWPLEWETVVQETVEKNTRLAIATTSLKDVLNGEQRNLVNSSIAATVQTAINDWGLTVHQIELLLIQPDPTVMRASSDKYQEIARSQAWGAAINEIVLAYTEARSQGVPDPVIYRELVRRLFEQAPVSPATKTRLQSELAHLFSTNVNAEDEK